jgi:TolB-like protein
MSQSRQLAAIMFTDIVGYSAQMRVDEQKAFELLKRNREIQIPIIEKHRGRWLKEMGDGTLVSFQSVSDAVQCAKEIQEICAKDDKLTLRIGLHLGEVVFEGNDVFGDGVNIASRLEPLAPEGGIVVSDSVHKNLFNKKDIETVLVGEYSLKNIPEPVKVYQVMLDGMEKPNNHVSKVAHSKGKPSKKTVYVIVAVVLAVVLALGYLLIDTSNNSDTAVSQSQEIIDKSIAVLPFANMSNDPDQEYFSDGISEEIINALVQIPDLKVSSRTSSFQFREEQDIKSIGDALGVATVLEGSVRKSGNRVRVTAQLINIADGFHLWSQTYERELNDIFAIQDELARSIVQALQIKINLPIRQLLTTETVDLEAYNSYLQAIYFMNKRNPEGLERSIEYFGQAIARDSLFARAYSGLSNAYTIMGSWGFAEPGTAYPKAEYTAERALELDNTLGSGYTSLGAARIFYSTDFQEAERLLNRAIELTPNDWKPHQLLSFVLIITGRKSAALSEAKKAFELDPLIAPVNFNLTRMYHWTGDVELAQSQALKTLEMDQNFAPVHRTLFHIYYLKGDSLSAFDHFVKWKSAYGENPEILKEAFNQSGWRSLARTMIPELKEKSRLEYLNPARFVDYYMLLNEHEKIMDYLEATLEEKDINPFLGIEPFYAPLHSNPRFQALLEKMGLPPVGNSKIQKSNPK